MPCSTSPAGGGVRRRPQRLRAPVVVGAVLELDAGRRSLTRSSPQVLPDAETESRTVTLSRAYSSVEEVVPARSSTLLVALLGGIVTLLILIAREWIR